MSKYYKKLVCATIVLILISSCEQPDEAAWRQKVRQAEAERLKQIIASRERAFAESSKRKQKQLIVVDKLPESKRKLIYQYMIILEEHGVTDVDENYRRTAKKFGITVKQAESIAVEATMKCWAQPEPPEPDFWKVK